MYQLVPKEERSGVEQAVSETFDKSRPTFMPIFTRQQVREAFRRRKVDEEAIERMCGPEPAVTEVKMGQEGNNHVVQPEAADGGNDGQDKTKGTTFEGTFAADEVKAVKEQATK